MSTITFDTLKFVEILESAGFERAQASAVATAVRDTHVNADAATKGDIALLKKDMDALENRLIVKLTRNMVLTVTFCSTVIGLIIKFL